MLIGPLPLCVIAPNDVKGRCKPPTALSIHQEGDIAGVIILVAGNCVKRHASEQLPEGLVPEPQLLAAHQGRFIAILPGALKVIVTQRAEGLHMDLACVAGAIKPAGHKMGPPVFFQQPA